MQQQPRLTARCTNLTPGHAVQATQRQVLRAWPSLAGHPRGWNTFHGIDIAFHGRRLVAMVLASLQTCFVPTHYWRPSMQWTTPAFTDLRFGFEITMYIANR
jgi:coenzyme PQQ precursor peptide PqqA